MKIERLEYLNKDIPLLKKDVAMRLLFMFLFLATFIWQFVLLVLNYMRGTLTSIRTILSVILLVSALMFTIISLIYAFRSFNIIQKVTVHGSSIKNITVIFENIFCDNWINFYCYVGCACVHHHLFNFAVYLFHHFLLLSSNFTIHHNRWV